MKILGLLLIWFIGSVHLYEWAREIGNEEDEAYTSLGFDSYGNVFMVGDSYAYYYHYEESGDFYDITLTKFDEDGDPIFRTGFHSWERYLFSVDIVVWDDGSTAILAIDDYNEYHIIQINATGQINRSMCLSPFDLVGLDKVEADGGYIVVGSGDDGESGGEDMIVMRFSSDVEEILWQETYTFIDDIRYDYGVSLAAAPDGNFYVGGYMSRDIIDQGTDGVRNMTISRIDIDTGGILCTFEIGVGECGTTLEDICLLYDGTVGFVGTHFVDGVEMVGIVGRVNISDCDEESASLIWSKKITLVDQEVSPVKCEGSKDDASMVVLTKTDEFTGGDRRGIPNIDGEYGLLSKYSPNGTLIFAKSYDNFRIPTSLGVNPSNGDIYFGGISTLISNGTGFFARASKDNGTACPAQETDLVDLGDGTQYDEYYLEEGTDIFFGRYDLMSIEAVDGSYYYVQVLSYPSYLDYNEVVYGCAACYGIPIENDTACNNDRGDCIWQDTCDCIEPYGGDDCSGCMEGLYGVDCDIVECYDVLSNYTGEYYDGDGNQVCSGHGECITTDDCLCDDETEWIGDNCDIFVCFGISSEDPDDTCSRSGDCIGVDECECYPSYHGAECLERVEVSESGSFINAMMNYFEIAYSVLQNFFDDSKLEMKNGERFNCSKVIYNWKEFLTYNSSYCQFTFTEITQDYLLSEYLIVHILDLDLYSDGEEDSDLPPLPDYQVPDNFSVVIKTVTYPETLFTVYIQTYDESTDLPDGDDDTGETDDSGANLLWAAITFPVAALVFVVVVILCTLLFCCVACVCFSCILCCFGTVSGLIARKNIDQKKGLKKFSKLRNFDILLKEQELDDDDSIAHIKINKELFEVDYDEIKIEKILGEGGSQSVVYRGKWNHMTVAFKCFKTRHICSSQDDFNEFEREVGILSSISHPNIIQFYGATLNPPRVGILMEYCENGDLDVFLRSHFTDEEPYAMSEKLRMLFEIATAMSYLHFRKIIHRDLKMENVLVDAKETCKCMDFGLSKIVDRMSKNKTQKIGTSCYMAPEIVNSQHYDEKCDVYSYAILVYIMVTHKWAPYEECQNVEMTVANDPTFRPEMKPFDDCPFFELEKDKEVVRDVMVKCWSHDAKERYSFSELCEILQKNFFVDRYELTKNVEDFVAIRQNLSQKGSKSYSKSVTKNKTTTKEATAEEEEQKPPEEGIKVEEEEESKSYEMMMEENEMLKSEIEGLKKKLEEFEKKKLDGF